MDNTDENIGRWMKEEMSDMDDVSSSDDPIDKNRLPVKFDLFFQSVREYQLFKMHLW